MSPILLWTIVFVGALAVLIKASDVLTDSASEIASYLDIPTFIIGVTIVSVGTSLPELTAGIAAMVEGAPEIPAASAIGSNIANILLVLGVGAIVNHTLKTSWDLVKIDLPLLVGSALFLAVVALDGTITLFESLLAISGFILYLHYTTSTHESRWFRLFHKEVEVDGKEKKKERPNWLVFTGLLLSPFFIYLGAKYTIESVMQLSQLLDIGAELLAVSVIALGTSLPELAVTVQASRKGKSEMAIGNILGSNIFNSFAVIGGAGLFGTIVVSQSLLTLGIPVMLAATFLYYFITQDKEVSPWEGCLLLIIYAAFVGMMFGMF